MASNPQSANTEPDARITTPEVDQLESHMAKHDISNGAEDQPKDDAVQGSPNSLTEAGVEVRTETVLPKKKKKKSKSKKGASKPTGFEEYYVDAPLTPAEFEEERNIYDPRIEACIQRYKAKRNFDSERKNMFDKYMTLGGINTEPKMFTGGLADADLEEKDARDIAGMTATTHVGEDKQDTSVWAVDFEAVVKGFFSSRVPVLWDLTTEKQIAACTSIVRNFLNYILHHDVCPEYNDQIHASRTICDLAEKELFAIKNVSSAFPGDFNTACSTLYGGFYHAMYTADKVWAMDMASNLGLSQEKAKQTVMAALAARGTDAQIEKAMKGTSAFHVSKSECVGFEVLEITPADSETKDFYASQPYGALQPIGTLKARRWYNPDAAAEDVTGDDEADARCPWARDAEWVFWVEDHVLEHCFVGMKAEAVVTQLDCGVVFFDAVISVFCSFFTVLDNELLIGWKDHVPLEPRRRRGGGDDDGGDEGNAETENGTGDGEGAHELD
ncbi:MAG: hypothetical protein M1819_001275 [Sarea resinae]|nr:MAG: hypothetical protein M1819_001275 [Sarea resinae]